MQRFFSDVAVFVDSLVNSQVYLNISITERPRVSQWKYEGVKRESRQTLKNVYD